MEEILEKMLEEQQKTNDLLRYNNKGKDPYEMLTAEQVEKEYGIRNKHGTRYVQRP